MLPPDPTSDQLHDFHKLLARPAFEKGCNSCDDAEALRLAWLEDDKPVGERTVYLEIWQHVHSCPDCQHWAQLAQADVEAAKAIPVQLPAMIGVEA